MTNKTKCCFFTWTPYESCIHRDNYFTDHLLKQAYEVYYSEILKKVYNIVIGKEEEKVCQEESVSKGAAMDEHDQDQNN